MAMNYAEYQRASAPEQASVVNQAQERIEGSLRLGPKLVDAERFFKDIYLLGRVGFLDTHPSMLTHIQQMGVHPKVRGEFVKILQAQDTVGDSKEVLAALVVGRTFDYHRELPFQTVFEKLAVKHEQLIAEAEVRRQAEEARRQAETEARRQARNNWPPPESNTGKSPEWRQAQEKIARLWENAKQRLPQGIERETQDADIAYFQTGFNLIKKEISAGAKPLTVRAMIEYLIPQVWRRPRMVEAFFRRYEQQQSRRPQPTSLSALDVAQKGLFIPLSLQGQVGPADKPQSKNIRTVFRGLTKAIHHHVTVISYSC